MKNIALTIAYDGTLFYGWQETAEGPSIEQHLREALERIVQHPVKLQAASRTDRGVHAEGQVVNFFTNRDVGILNINALLPPQIRVCALKQMPETFHPTLDVVGKEYHYKVCLGPVQRPDRHLFSWHVPGQIDVQRMQKQAPLLVGTHDFSAFCTKVTYADSIRTLEKVRIFEEGDTLLFVIRGDNFLYKMARTVVGSLIHVGQGRLDNLEEVLKRREREDAGMTAPAHGLCLKKVLYDWSQ